MRIVPTPLADNLPSVGPRPGGTLAPGLRDAFRCPPEVAPLLERLGGPDTLVVTTGQQPGLFTGPLYTLYKALSAAALARTLETLWERPVVPVFWLANDDHDFAEARETAWLDPEGAVVRRGLPPRPPGAPMTPMYRLRLDPEIESILTEFERTAAASPFGAAAVAWLRRHYRPGRTLGDAFGDALAELLAPYGVLCLDSAHPAVKRAAAPLLLRALQAAPVLDAELGRRAGQLAAEGRPAPVAVGDGATLVFLEDDAGRDRLLVRDGAVVTRRTGERLAPERLQAISELEPERLSPNVLLRPVAESALLPTVAYIAGPGELAYLPLARPLYEHLEVPVQMPVPRWSGMVVEPRVDRVLRRFEATLDELLQPGQALEHRVVRSGLPAELLAAAERLRAAVTTEYDTLRRGAVGIDPTLDRPIERLRHVALEGVAQAVRAVERHLTRRDSDRLAQIQRARSSLVPEGHPQERVLGPAGFLARYGPSFLETVWDGIREWYASALVGAAASP